jgi:hypothetical protein
MMIILVPTFIILGNGTLSFFNFWSILFRVVGYVIDQGGPTFFFPLAKNSFLLDPIAKKTPLDTILKINSQFALYLKTLVQR